MDITARTAEAGREKIDTESWCVYISVKGAIGRVLLANIWVLSVGVFVTKRFFQVRRHHDGALALGG